MSEQEMFWKGMFGDKYTTRNDECMDVLYKRQYGITRSELNREFLSNIDMNLNILEVGCNRGLQLQMLYSQGYHSLWGMDINEKALDIARNSNNYVVVEGSVFDIPFIDNSFGLVFTSGLLIHIHPNKLKDAIKELYRVSSKYIWCFEYYSEKCKSIVYRGHKNKMWRNDFKRVFQEQYPDIKVVKELMIKSSLYDTFTMMFLLEKEKG